MTLAAALLRHRPPLDVWDQWDGAWYLGIASHGYHWRLHWHLHNQSSLAFFPLYPSLVRVGMAAGLPGMLVAVLISNVAFVGTLFYVYRLAALEWGDPQQVPGALLRPAEAARGAVWIVALFPTAFFTFAPYTEALFLLCAAGALYHARLGQTAPAALWLAAAIVTRSTGVILIPAAVVLLGARRRETWLACLGAPAAALGGYLLYLVLQHLPFTLLLQSQRGWHRELTYPWTGFSASIMWLFHHQAASPGMVAENVSQLGITVLFLLLTLAAWRHLGRGAALYCAGFWILVLSMPEWLDGYYAPFSSMDRFVLILFPLAGWAATCVPAHRLRLLLAAFAALMVGAAGVHLAGGWVG